LIVLLSTDARGCLMRLDFSSWLVLFLLATNHVYGFLRSMCAYNAQHLHPLFLFPLS
jgi:hypothetical protein